MLLTVLVLFEFKFGSGRGGGDHLCFLGPPFFIYILSELTNLEFVYCSICCLWFWIMRMLKSCCWAMASMLLTCWLYCCLSMTCWSCSSENCSCSSERVWFVVFRFFLLVVLARVPALVVLMLDDASWKRSDCLMFFLTALKFLPVLPLILLALPADAGET